jgi:hypothetical protein
VKVSIITITEELLRQWIQRGEDCIGDAERNPFKEVISIRFDQKLPQGEN